MFDKYFRGVTVLFFFSLCISIYGFETDKCSVSGKIYINHPGMLFVYLVDEESSRTPLAGLVLKIEPDQNDIDAGFVSFIFSNLEQGTYGIRCFQDLNNNGKLE